MAYCKERCKYLDEKKHKCTATGEKLTYMRVHSVFSFTVHEHREFCELDKERYTGGTKVN